MDAIGHDLRLAGRRLSKRPGFAAVAVIGLALGLGANVALFTLGRAALSGDLPVPRPGELLRLGANDNCCVNSGLQGDVALFSRPGFDHLRRNLPEFASLAGFQANTQSIGVRRAGAAGTESLPSQFVTANYFDMFELRPAAGRLLTVADDAPGAAPVFVLGHHAWTRHFGADPSLVGSSFWIAGRPVTLVGVAPEGFFGDTLRPDPAALWLPMGVEPYLRGPASLHDRPDQDWLYAIGRVPAGVAVERVEERATAALRHWLAGQSFLDEASRQRLDEQRIRVVSARGGVAFLRGSFGRPLALLFAMSVLVLAMTVVNLANLLLARSDRSEIALQSALGAGRDRLVRQAFVGGLLLALPGAALGLGVARLATGALVALVFPGVGHLPVDPAVTTLPALGFALGLALLAGAAFSAAPAWAMAREQPFDALRGGDRAGEGRSFVPRRSLVVLQVALSAVLLFGAGLLTQSLRRLERQPLGFEVADRFVVRVRTVPPAGGLPRLEALYAELRAGLGRVPGVLDVSHALYSPMQGDNWSSPISIAGLDPGDGTQLGSSWNRVGPRYFETLGTKLRRGRSIEERDGPAAPRVAVVNEAFVRQFFPQGDPVGRRLGIGGPAHAGDFEIVGVSEDVKYAGPTRPTRPMIFFPALQMAEYGDPTARGIQLRSTLAGAIVLRTAPGTGVATLEPLVRRAIGAIDPDIAVQRVLPMSDQVRRNFTVQRLLARLAEVYGTVALALAALGLYAVTAHAVARRRREIGLRMALGASPGGVVRQVLREALAQTGFGLLLGVPAALLAARSLAGLLFGVGAGDPLALAAAAAVLLLVTLVAAALPARRAAAVQPARTLRAE